MKYSFRKILISSLLVSLFTPFVLSPAEAGGISSLSSWSAGGDKPIIMAKGGSMASARRRREEVERKRTLEPGSVNVLSSDGNGTDIVSVRISNETIGALQDLDFVVKEAVKSGICAPPQSAQEAVACVLRVASATELSFDQTYLLRRVAENGVSDEDAFKTLAYLNPQLMSVYMSGDEVAELGSVDDSYAKSFMETLKPILPANIPLLEKLDINFNPDYLLGKVASGDTLTNEEVFQYALLNQDKQALAYLSINNPDVFFRFASDDERELAREGLADLGTPMSLDDIYNKNVSFIANEASFLTSEQRESAQTKYTMQQLKENIGETFDTLKDSALTIMRQPLDVFAPSFLSIELSLDADIHPIVLGTPVTVANMVLLGTSPYSAFLVGVATGEGLVQYEDWKGNPSEYVQGKNSIYQEELNASILDQAVLD